MATENAIATLNKTKQNVLQRLDDYISKGQIIMPQNYSFGNALNQLQLQIQDDPKIMSCTQNSIAKAMLDLAILGLNTTKQQAYLIPYGTQAKLHVSYLGKVALAKRADPTIDEIIGRPVKKGEVFEFEDLPNGYSKIIKHKRTLDSMDSREIVGAYATITYKPGSGKESKSLIMTFERIKKSWSMSQMHPVNQDGSIKAGSTHDKFMDDMAIKTVISAICKPIINTSDDGSLFYRVAQSVDLNEMSAMSKETTDTMNGVGDYIDIDYEPVEEVNEAATEEQTTDSVPNEPSDGNFHQESLI